MTAAVAVRQLKLIIMIGPGVQCVSDFVVAIALTELEAHTSHDVTARAQCDLLCTLRRLVGVLVTVPVGT